MYQLGGHSVFLNAEDLHIGSRDSFFDTVGVLSQYIDAIMIRSNSHHDVEKLAEISSVPVINGQTNLHNPCQALADLLTIYEYKDSFKGVRLAYVGDANNITNSLLFACA
jgi:ornithine carbamoyltransferase